jgi:hypothetical protein
MEAAAPTAAFGSGYAPAATPATGAPSIEQPIWQRTVVNAHVLAFRDLYLSLGSAPAAPQAATPTSPQAPSTPAQLSLLRLCRRLPRVFFGDTAEQRLTYARIFAALQKAGGDAAKIEAMAVAAGAEEDGTAAIFQSALSGPEGGSVRPRAEGEGGRARAGGVAAEGPFEESPKAAPPIPEDGPELRAWCDAFMEKLGGD